MRLTIQAGIVGLTRREKEILDREYTNLQRFLKIPVYGVRGGIKVPVKPHGEFPDGKLYESKIVRRGERYIALGNLTEIRRRAKGKGKRLNRTISNIPHHHLTKMIEYKAMLVGIPVITTSEAYTSQTCHIRGCEGKRKTQGLFICPHRGKYNANPNVAINIAKRFKGSLGHMPSSGAACEHAHNQPMLEAPCESWGQFTR